MPPFWAPIMMNSGGLGVCFMGGGDRLIFGTCTDSAPGGKMEIRSHFDALRKFDRSLTHGGNSIAQIRFDRTDTPDDNSIAHSTF